MVEIQAYIKRLNEGIIESPELQMFRRLRPAKFSELCKLRLSFLIDVPCEFIYGNQLNDTQSITKYFFSGSNKIQAKMLEESGICDRIIDNIMKLIQHLEQESCIETEGIFRKSGNLSRQRELKDLILRGHDISTLLQPNEKSQLSQYSVHDVAGTLKNLLADLMQPLLTTEFLDYFLQVANLCLKSCDTVETDSGYLIRKGKQINSIRLLLLLLPQQNRDILRQLLALLHKVSLYQTRNRMTSESLGTLFGPLLLTKKKITSKELKNNFSILNQLTTYMIEKEENLFLIPQSIADDVSNCLRKLQQQQFGKNSNLTSSSECAIYPSMGFQRAKSETSLHIFQRDSCLHTASSEPVDNDSADEEFNTCVNFTKQRVSNSTDAKEPELTNVSYYSCKSLSVDAIILDSPSTDYMFNHDATKYAVAELYAQVQALPESSEKRKWIQKFNQHNGTITPCRYPKRIKHISNSDIHKTGSGGSVKEENVSLVTDFNRQGNGHGIRSSLRKRLALRNHLQIAPISLPTKYPSKTFNSSLEKTPTRSLGNPISPNSDSTDSTSSYTSSTSQEKIITSGDMIPFVDLVNLQCPDEQEELDVSPENKPRCSPFKRGWKSRMNLLPSSPILTSIKSTSHKSYLKREKHISSSDLITSPQGVDFCDSATCSLTPKTRKLTIS